MDVFVDVPSNLSHGKINCTTDFLHIKAGYFFVEVFTAFFAVLGNIFICFVVVRRRKLRTVTNFFLVSLAVADMLVGAIAIPCALLSDLGLPVCRYYLCVLMLCSMLVLTQASIFGLFAVAVERYIAVLAPFRYQQLVTNRSAAMVIFGSWALAVVIGLVPLMGWRKAATPNETCIFYNIIDQTYMVYFNFILCMLLPLLAMFVIYAKIFTEARRQIRRIAERHVNISVEEKRRRVVRKELRTATSLFILLFCFTLSWIPIHILNCIELFCPHYHIPTPLMLATIILSHANSVVNPIVYVFRIRTFWDAFRDLFPCLGVFSKHFKPDFTGIPLGNRCDVLPGN
ncbi:adenosine receptor A1-like [Leucoraja erinacea]|uniref:adenosine receptor A1-like n=1 Tax=Leucoraja erinaceus TaxID=7782 RepID=UPI0024541ADE|nr:adenosine receptor A1-like [Leucoraja erinacea]